MRTVATAAVTALLAGSALGQSEISQAIHPAELMLVQCGELVCTHNQTHLMDAQAEAELGAERLIAAQTFWSLPPEARADIAAALEARGEQVPVFSAPVDPALAERAEPLTEEEFAEAFAAVEAFTTREAFERFGPIHQRMLSNFANMAQQDDWIPVLPCFTPGTDLAMIEAFDAIVSFGLSQMQLNNPARFEQTGRWTNTALDPTGGGQGNPTTLTYSFPDDGTFIPSGVGEPSGNNNLNAFFDGIYGNRATWRAIYDEIFTEWGNLSGVTYVLEPNDDNMSLFNNPGISGVRGDLRMTGKLIDGNSNTLAYNFFPNGGDMVIDTADNFYTNTFGNSIRLRNILYHEHGHGMGQLHTCPITQSKLMEPFISTAFDGPQFDDILNAQRHYGDPLEPNDTVATASPLGSLSVGQMTTVDTVSLDDDFDTDVYSFSVPTNANVTVSLTPQGGLYQAGPQTGNCNENQPYNPLLFLNPAIQVIDSDGLSILGAADNFATGFGETLTVSVSPGTYYVRATASAPSGDQIIAYELDVEVDIATISLVTTGVPATVAPGVTSSFEIEILPGDESIVGTPTVTISDGTTSFVQNLINTDGTLWRVDLPAFLCSDSPSVSFEVEGSISGVQQVPTSGAFDILVADSIGATFSDNADVDLGYTVSGNAGDGQWTLGAPQGNGRGDPATDFDGSGSAWLTDIDPGTDNSDVDNGETILTSPPVDLVEDSSVTLAYWFNDIASGEIQGGDSFRVQVSTDNGASYTTVRTFTTASDSWRTTALTEGVDYTASAPGEGRLRFIVDDIGTQNVIEGGVDAIVVNGVNCMDPQGPMGCNAADLVEPFGLLDLSDVQAFLIGFGNMDPIADIAGGMPSGGDGLFDLTDVQTFLIDFGAGCP